MRGLPRHERKHRLDFLGAGLIVASTVAFMFAITAGGVRFAWSSPLIICLLIFSAIVAALFIVRLKTAPEPLIPLSILNDKVARYAIATNALGWGGMVSLNIYLPIYLQDVLGMSATAAGFSLMILMGVLNASAGLISPTIGRQAATRSIPLIGLASATLAVGVLAWQAEQHQFLGLRIPAGDASASASARSRRSPALRFRTRCRRSNSAPPSAR